MSQKILSWLLMHHPFNFKSRSQSFNFTQSWVAFSIWWIHKNARRQATHCEDIKKKRNYNNKTVTIRDKQWSRANAWLNAKKHLRRRRSNETEILTDFLKLSESYFITRHNLRKTTKKLRMKIAANKTSLWVVLCRECQCDIKTMGRLMGWELEEAGSRCFFFCVFLPHWLTNTLAQTACSCWPSQVTKSQCCPWVLPISDI